MILNPLHDRVIVRKDTDDKVTPGGIIVPETVDNKDSCTGVVVKVGTGKLLKDGTLLPLTVKEGDRVIWGKFTGTEIKIEDIDHVLLREEDIYGILE